MGRLEWAADIVELNDLPEALELPFGVGQIAT